MIIAGGRDFDDPKLLFSTCDRMLQNQKEVEIVSGGQKTLIENEYRYIGADFFGEMYAYARKHQLKVFPANWDEYGKSAGPIRNKQMADYADALILFWDGTSKGSKSMLDLAEAKGLKIFVKRY